MALEGAYIVDLEPRTDSVNLTAENRRGLFVPERFAHGYQVLEDDTETTYRVGEFYTPSAESGLRYSDPRLAIEWPLPVDFISPKDQQWGLLDDVETTIRQRMEPHSTHQAGAGVTGPE